MSKPVLLVLAWQLMVTFTSLPIVEANEVQSVALEFGGTAANYGPIVDTVNSPADGTNDVPLSPTLSITVSNPETNDIAVTFFGRLAGSGPDFTIVALPDTQYYSATYPSIFQTQIDWIVNNRTNLNIVYVAHLGDITDVGNCQPYQWGNATNALYRLENPVTTSLPDGIPYGVVPGNHDHLCGVSLYNTYFGASHFASRSYYGGNLAGNNQNHYDLISAGGMNFVIVYLDFNYSNSDVNYPAIDAWANGVLQSNVNRRAIVVSHCILRANGSYDSDRSPSVYSRLQGNPNLFLMLCGHNYGESWRQDNYQGHAITTCLSDYQFDPNGGNGFLRLYQFSPSNNLVRVKTYSPYLNQYETDADSQFEFGYQMSDGANASYFVIGITNVPSGATANMLWPGLTPNTKYEWYVALNQGTNTINGSTWRFTTTDTGTNVAPTVALVEPANGTFVSPGTNLALRVTAGDAEGFVSRVNFLTNGALFATTTASSQSIIWSNAIAGVYSLTAVAFDSGGLYATSTPVVLTVVNPLIVTNTLIADGSIWKYLDTGSDQGTNWINLTFDDSSWSAGPAELGYGDAADGNPEATIVNYGPDPGNKYVTTYFRRTLVITNAASYTALALGVIRDDGIVVYLNGTGVYTNNMPDTFAYNTSAYDDIDDEDEYTWQTASIAASHLREGTNVIAAEVHQVDVTSSDISFNLKLDGFIVVPFNLPPVADGQSTNIAAEASADLALSGRDPNGDSLTFILNGSPTHGLLSGFNAQTGAVNYRPAHGFAGTDTFKFSVSDGTNISTHAAVTIQVIALADNNSNGLPDAWETAHGVTDPNTDDDGDGFTNLQEYEAGTDPNDATSMFRIAKAYSDAISGWVTITWPSVGGVRYRVCYSDGGELGHYTGEFNQIVRPASVEIDPAPTGSSSTQTFTDDFTLTGGAPTNGARYFRVKIVQ